MKREINECYIEYIESIRDVLPATEPTRVSDVGSSDDSAAETMLSFQRDSVQHAKFHQLPNSKRASMVTVTYMKDKQTSAKQMGGVAAPRITCMYKYYK